MEVEQRPQFLYANISPKLRIKGKGFGKDASGVHPVFVPPLEKNGKRFYNLTVTDTVISIGLKKGMRWPTSTTGESSTLFLQSRSSTSTAPRTSSRTPCLCAIVSPLRLSEVRTSSST